MVLNRIAAASAVSAAMFASLLPSAGFAADNREADLRCLAGFAARAGSATDDQTKQGATIGLIYYLGRIDGEAPQTNLQAELERLTQSMSDADFASVMPDCGKRLGQRGQVLTQIGNSMTAKAKK